MQDINHSKWLESSKSSIRTILEALVACPSISPDDAGCQSLLIRYLEPLGFHCQRLDSPPVSNLFACIGQGEPCFIFAGHTDVVPIGEISQWQSNPFRLTEHERLCYGRGVADMKGSLASMLVAAARFVNQHPSFHGRLGFLITSGEEGDDYNLGTPYVMEALKRQGIHPNYCLVGEPSSSQSIGDTIKIGRRGSLSATLTLKGRQGHVAYPQLADNPIHAIAPMLAELTTTSWDTGNDHFPPTSLQITRIHADGKASNVIPGTLMLDFNLRYSTEHTHQDLIQRIETCCRRHLIDPLIQWRFSGEPFLTSKGPLLEHTINAIKTHTGIEPILSTSGGTSDGRFIAPFGVEVVELGPLNATIHQVNESVSLDDLLTLSHVYYDICVAFLG